jgi:tRNA threonylcarbamoyladenosine biosynthesis protein TsaE
VVLIEGDLGAGKTTFVRGALRALGVAERVTSPTFVVGQLYESGRVRAAHLDLYRLGSSTEAEDPGLLDPFFGADTITFVEWPGDLEGTRRVTLAHAGGDRRSIEWS